MSVDGANSAALELAPFAGHHAFADWIDLDAPLAGANASYVVPGQYEVAVVAARCSLTTDSNAANRFVSLDYLNGRGVTYVRNAAALVVTASTTGQAFEWNGSRTVAEWAANTPVLAPCLDVFLPPAAVIRVTVDNIQAGDQLSAVHLFVVKVQTNPAASAPSRPGRRSSFAS